MHFNVVSDSNPDANQHLRPVVLPLMDDHSHASAFKNTKFHVCPLESQGTDGEQWLFLFCLTEASLPHQTFTLERRVL